MWMIQVTFRKSMKLHNFQFGFERFAELFWDCGARYIQISALSVELPLADRDLLFDRKLCRWLNDVYHSTRHALLSLKFNFFSVPSPSFSFFLSIVLSLVIHISVHCVFTSFFKLIKQHIYNIWPKVYIVCVIEINNNEMKFQIEIPWRKTQ